MFSFFFFFFFWKRIWVNYQWNAPFSRTGGGLNWCTVALSKTQTGGTTSTFCFSPWVRGKTDALHIHPVLLPVSGVSDAVLKSYALLNSSRILPSHPVPAVRCWTRTLGCRAGGLPASCVGSKYLHSPPSRVARRRGLDVLGYVKSNPPGRVFNRLSLLELIFEQIHFTEVFWSSWYRLGQWSRLQTTHLVGTVIKGHISVSPSQTVISVLTFNINSASLAEGWNDIHSRNANPHWEHVCLSPLIHQCMAVSQYLQKILGHLKPKVTAG